jgi:uncharacterized protein
MNSFPTFHVLPSQIDVCKRVRTSLVRNRKDLSEETKKWPVTCSFENFYFCLSSDEEVALLINWLDQEIERERKGNWIQTWSGRTFFPTDPRPEDVFIEDIANALSKICRFGGHCREFYSVAQHCTLGALALEKAGGAPELCLAFHLHDASETYVQDIPRPLKQQEEMSEYRKVEDRVSRVIYEKYDLGYYLLPDNYERIKKMDMQLLATEKRDLMAPCPCRWKELPTPLPKRIRPWSPKRARDMYLWQFERLSLLSSRSNRKPSALRNMWEWVKVYF